MPFDKLHSRFTNFFLLNIKEKILYIFVDSFSFLFLQNEKHKQYVTDDDDIISRAWHYSNVTQKQGCDLFDATKLFFLPLLVKDHCNASSLRWYEGDCVCVCVCVGSLKL